MSNEINIGLKLRNMEKVAVVGDDLLGFSIVMIEAIALGLGTRRNYDMKLMGQARKSGDTTINAPQGHLLQLPNSIKAGFLIGDGAGARAEIDCVPSCCTSANYTFNTNKGVTDSYGIRASLANREKFEGLGMHG